MKEYQVFGIICKVGKNAEENWKLLDESNDNNLFFHLTYFPSCYVILQCDENIVYNENYKDILKKCSEICKENTKFKKLPNLRVDYTFCNNIEKGNNIGEIFYKSLRKTKEIIV